MLFFFLTNLQLCSQSQYSLQRGCHRGPPREQGLREPPWLIFTAPFGLARIDLRRPPGPCPTSDDSLHSGGDALHCDTFATTLLLFNYPKNHTEPYALSWDFQQRREPRANWRLRPESKQARQTMSRNRRDDAAPSGNVPNHVQNQPRTIYLFFQFISLNLLVHPFE